MNETVYTAAFVLPMTSAPLANGAIHARGDRIVAVGPFAALQAASPKVKVVDFGSAILMPPLVNAHTHLELTDFPQWQAEAKQTDTPDDFAEWILQVIHVKRERQHNDFFTSLTNGLRQSLASGTGVVVDILSKPELAEAYNGSPLLGRIDLELIGQDRKALDPLLERAAQWLAGRSAAQPTDQACHLERGLSPHAPYTVAPELLKQFVAFAETHLAAMSIHTAESAAELELLQDSTGVLAEKLYPAVGWLPPDPPLRTSPLDYLDSAEALRRSTLLVHAVHLTAAEIGRIGRIGNSVVLCPRSNQRLGCGVAPVEQYLCRGVNMALGTDSLSSNDSLSIWDEMEAAHRLYADHLSTIQIVAMATINGAVALGLDNEVGALEPGSGAHFLVLQPETLPERSDLAPFLCRGERQRDLVALYLNGVDVFPTAE
jgi:cytosine/adenosine deaminase-related metal-dependent hydrolase